MLGSGIQTSLCLFPNGRSNEKGFEVCYAKSCEWLGSMGHRSGFFSTLHHSHKMCVLVAEDGVKVSEMDWVLHKAPYRLRRSFVTKVLRRAWRSHDEAALMNVLNPRMVQETLAENKWQFKSKNWHGWSVWRICYVIYYKSSNRWATWEVVSKSQKSLSS